MTDDPPFDLTGALPFDSDADAMTPQKPGAYVLGDDFAYIGRGLDAADFRLYVNGYRFGSVPPDYIVLHHTAIPSASWARYPTGAVWDAGESGMDEAHIKAKRLRQLDQLRNYYRDVKRWRAGPHLFVDEKWIWLFTPMYDVGIHAAKGNSYRDAGGVLHYSIGIEVVGYYEHTHWPPAVAANVRAAVAALYDRLHTFAYVDKPWAGGISAHRNYNKPACPGAAIVPSYYMAVLRGVGQDPAQAANQHYRVKAKVTGPVVVRSAPSKEANVVKSLHAGDDFWGLPIEDGELVTIHGFGSSKVWICNESMLCVWAGLLEKVKE